MLPGMTGVQCHLAEPLLLLEIDFPRGSRPRKREFDGSERGDITMPGTLWQQA
jgi:hypothetical protein